MKHLIASACLAALLSGCAAVAPIAAGTGTLGLIATGLQIAAAAQPLMTDAEKLACAGQAAANAATDAATRLGKTTAAQDSSLVSRALGFGCTWL